MYRSFGIGLIILGLFVLSGCRNDNSENETNQSSTSGSELYSEGDVNQESNTEEFGEIDKYEIVTKKYEKGNISIKYPQFKNALENDFTEKWNKFIEDHTMISVSDNSSIPDTNDEELFGGDGFYTVDYEIKTKNDKMISILCTEYLHFNGAAHPYSTCYTYNINLLTGKSIMLKDIDKLHKYAEDIFSGKNYSYVRDLEEEDYLSDIRDDVLRQYKDVESLAKNLEKYDFDIDKEYITGNNDVPLGYSYYENNKIVICMEVSHALGDYVQLVMDTNNGGDVIE